MTSILFNILLAFAFYCHAIAQFQDLELRSETTRQFQEPAFEAFLPEPQDRNVEPAQTGWDLLRGLGESKLPQLESNGTSPTTEPSILFRRQTRRCPVGTYACDAISCCRIGYDCVPGGCCPSGTVPCGSSSCYNPRSQICCGAGRACSLGYVCTSAGCCPQGNSPCGTNRCYNPRTQVCCSDGTSCSRGYDCMGRGTGRCCPSGNRLCGSSRCYNPNTQVCCGDGTTCPKGSTCYSDRCCTTGKIPCGNRGCYDPNTQVCCSDGRTCSKGYDCVSGGRCCRSGRVPCEPNGCYDPKTEVCCSGTSRYCPKGYNCVGQNRCCLSGEQPCGPSKCYNPSNQKCCTSGALAWGCDTNGTCCGQRQCCRAGAICGLDGYCSTRRLTSTRPPTSRYTSTRSIPKTTKSIPKTTTPKISTPKVSTPKTESSSAPETTESSSEPASSAPITSSTKSRPCTTPTPNPPQTKTQTIPFVYDPNRVSIPKDGPYRGQRISHTNRAVIWNMCRGINKYNGGRGGNTLTLTHGGKCFQTWNRREMCTENGVSFCRSGLNDYINSLYTPEERARAQAAITAAGDLTCDEFPFATSIEGGDLGRGVRICVPSMDQSFQGTSMGRFFNLRIAKGDTIRPGEKYVIQIRGWNCNTNSPDPRIKRSVELQKRDAFSNDGVSFVGDEMWRGLYPESPETNIMAMPLGDLDSGAYNINLNVTKGAMNLTLIDYNGTPYDFSMGGITEVSFQLDDRSNGLILSGETFDDDLEVSYKAIAAATTPSTSASANGSPTSTPNDSKYTRPSLFILSVCISFCLYEVI